MKKEILLLGFSDKQFNYFKENFNNSFTVTKYHPDKKQKPQLILINWKTPELCNELNQLKQYKHFAEIPVLLYTPFKEHLILQCYTQGINDFIDENWAFEIVRAKIKSWLKCRFKTKKKDSAKIRIGSVQINLKKRKVTRKGKEVDLTKIEYDILSLLAEDKTKIYSREEIYDKIWGNDVIVGERTLDVHMNNLRKKIGKSKIKTKKGIGFSINPDL